MKEIDPETLDDFSRMCHTLRNKIGSVAWSCKEIEKNDISGSTKAHVESIRDAIREMEEALESWGSRNGVRV